MNRIDACAFSPDWTGAAGVDAPARALLDQAAMVELFTRMSKTREDERRAA